MHQYEVLGCYQFVIKVRAFALFVKVLFHLACASAPQMDVSITGFLKHPS